jgi:predicted metal-dependent phosphoesterase TrpH
MWYRGNTHTHTNNSDGDSTPLAVATTYRDLGYNFVVITDHNKLTDVDTLNAQLQVPGQFLVIKGEEVTDSFGGKPVHLNGINNASSVNPQHGTDVLSTMENNLNAIRQSGGLQ